MAPTRVEVGHRSQPASETTSRWARYAPQAAIAGAALATFSILGSHPKSDDFLHLFEAVELPFPEYLMRPHGGHLIPVHRAIYAALYAVFGLSWFPYMLLQYMTHVGNAALVYFLGKTWSGSRFAAAFGAVLWSAAPVHLGTLNWFATYGQVIATTAFLIVLLDLTRYSLKRQPPSYLSVGAWYLLMLSGVGSFAIATALSVALLPIAFVLLEPRSGRLRTLKLLVPLVIVPVVYQMQAESGGMGYNSNLLRSDRLVSLFFELCAYGAGTLLFGPVATVTEREKIAFDMERGVGIGIGAVALVAIVIGVVHAYRRTPASRRKWFVTTLLFGVAAYGVIAVGRAPQVALADSVWMATRFRYHYAATVPMALAVALALPHLPGFAAAARRELGVGVIAGIALVDTLAGYRIDGAWVAQTEKFTNAANTQMLDNILSAPEGDVYLHNSEFPPLALVLALGVKKDRFPYLAGWYAISQPENTFQGRRVRFVEPDTQYVERVRARVISRMKELLVTEEEVRRANAKVLGLPRPTNNEKTKKGDSAKRAMKAGKNLPFTKMKLRRRRPAETRGRPTASSRAPSATPPTQASTAPSASSPTAPAR